MNQKLAREIRRTLRVDIAHFIANTVNRPDGHFSPKKYAYDFEKKSYVKIGKGTPFSYSADSPRKIYRNRKKNLKRAIRRGIPFNSAISFYVEKEISRDSEFAYLEVQNRYD